MTNFILGLLISVGLTLLLLCLMLRLLANDEDTMPDGDASMTPSELAERLARGERWEIDPYWRNVEFLARRNKETNHWICTKCHRSDCECKPWQCPVCGYGDTSALGGCARCGN